MAGPLKRLRRNLSARLARFLAERLSRLPRERARARGRMLGRIAYYLFFSSRVRALRHLALAYDDELPRAERRQIVRRMFCHFGETLLENLVIHRWGPEKMYEQILIHDWEEGQRKIDAMLQEGRGVIIVQAHMGNWELFAARGFIAWSPIACIGRRYDVTGYQELLEKVRAGMGFSVIYQDESMLATVRVLKQNGVLGMLPDQDAKYVPGIFSEFFGVRAYTPVAPANLCLRVGSPIVPASLVRDGDDYRLCVGDTIRREMVEGEKDPVAALTLLWNRALEKEIRRFPEQWLWPHRRWHTTPEILALRQERWALKKAGSKGKRPAQAYAGRQEKLP